MGKRPLTAWSVFSIVLALVSGIVTPALATKPCSLSFWGPGDKCHTPSGAICEFETGRTWRCSKTSTERPIPSSRPRQPEAKTASTSAGAGSPRSVVKINPVVAAEVRTLITFQTAVSPDCGVLPITLRVLQQPINGKHEVLEEPGFAFFAQSNPRSKCNDKNVPGTAIYYTSNPAFKGTDHVSIETFSADGGYRETRFVITVK